MALRLRRGTDAERQTITPLEGELIYTTDTKKLYVGDGSTAGGLAADTDTITDNFADLTDVDLTGLTDGQTIAYNLGNTRFEPANLPTSINDLSDVDTTDVTAGKVLKWNGSVFVTELEGAITEGATYNISIDGDVSGSVFADDSTLLVDGVSGVVTGDINNQIITTKNVNSAVLSLSGTDSEGVKAGINIVTDGTTLDDYSLFAINSYHNEADPSAAVFFRSRGTPASPTNITAGDNIFANYYLAQTSTGPGVIGSMLVSADPNGTIADGITPGQISFTTYNDAGTEITGLSINRNGAITVADNTVVAGAASGEVDDSAVVDYLQVTVGSTTYAMPLYAIRP